MAWFRTFLSIAFLTAAAAAQSPGAPGSTGCPTSPTPGPDAFAGWTAPSPLAAAADRQGLIHSGLELGRSADVTLMPTPQVEYVLRPEKPGGSVSYGGLLGLVVSEGGTYRIALSSAAWIDVVRDGKAVVSSAHGPGPACSSARKVVDFALDRGRYVLQVSANGAPTIRVMQIRQR